MSLINLQTAVATLIRLPSHHRNLNLDKFVTSFDLTEEEQEMLRQIGSDPLVVKYGYSMNHHRRQKLDGAMLISKFYFDSTELDEFWAKGFEPHAKRTPVESYELHFFDFILNHPEARSVMENKPAFLVDILAFERVQILFKREVVSRNEVPDQPSRFRHCGFEFLQTHFQIAELFANFPEATGEKLEPPEPQSEQAFYIFIQTEMAPRARVFEIDKQSYHLLRQAKLDPESGLEGLEPGVETFLVNQGLLEPKSQ